MSRNIWKNKAPKKGIICPCPRFYNSVLSDGLHFFFDNFVTVHAQFLFLLLRVFIIVWKPYRFTIPNNPLLSNIWRFSLLSFSSVYPINILIFVFLFIASTMHKTASLFFLSSEPIHTSVLTPSPHDNNTFYKSPFVSVLSAPRHHNHDWTISLRLYLPADNS